MYGLLWIFFVYGFLGWCIEVAYAAVKSKQFVNRGFLNGPICPIYGVGVNIVLQFLTPLKEHWIFLFIVSTILVTALEWITGFILEKIFRSKWWDYSNLPLNLNGYVCLSFSLIWGAVCLVVVYMIHPIIHSGVMLLPHVIGIIILVILLLVLFVDVYVTASGILKLNKRLAKMEEIAKELHRISDELGESIYKEVTEVIEKRDVTSQKIKETSESVKANIQQLKASYNELSHTLSRHNSRILKAFPKMQSSKYKEALEELKKHLKRK